MCASGWAACGTGWQEGDQSWVSPCDLACPTVCCLLSAQGGAQGRHSGALPALSTGQGGVKGEGWGTESHRPGRPREQRAPHWPLWGRWPGLLKGETKTKGRADD